MTPLVPLAFCPPGNAARNRWRVAAVAASLAVAPIPVRAQAYLTHTEDAAPIPKGVMRVRVLTAWTRYDERFTPTGRRPFGDDISTDSLGPRQFPFLIPAERALQTLTSDPGARLTFGRLAAQSDVRIVTTPIVVEYGLTKRFSIGVKVPIVQARRSVSLRVNPDSSGNVGSVPVRLRRSAGSTNALVYGAFKSAADSLGVLIARCPSNPSASGCAAVNANSADADATRALAQRFADAVRAAFGTDSGSALVAPRAGTLATRIEEQRAALNARVRRFLGAGAGANAGVFMAPYAFSYVDLQGRNGVPGLLQSTLGGGLDSVRTTNRLVLNGFTIGAQYLLLDRFQYDSLPARGIQMRLAVGGGFRYEPQFPDSARKLGLAPVGDGSAVELRAAMDALAGSIGATIVAHYAHQLPRTSEGPLLGDPEAFFPVGVFGPVTRTAGNVLAVELTPRVLLGEWFAIDGHYGFERTGPTLYERSAPAGECTICSNVPSFSPSTAARTAQRTGMGLRYSTVDAYLRGRVKTPVEVSFTHLETRSGDPGVPMLQRDQIQVRLFVRLLSGR